MADESAESGKPKKNDPPLAGQNASANRAVKQVQSKHWLDYANLIVSVLVLFVAMFGFMATKGQIRDAAAQIVGSTLYNLARDGRELMHDQRKGIAEPEDVLSYFHSAYLLHERGVIDEEGWEPLSKAYCHFIQSSEAARSYLEKYRSYYDDDFNEFSKPLEEKTACE